MLPIISLIWEICAPLKNAKLPQLCCNDTTYFMKTLNFRCLSKIVENL